MASKGRGIRQQYLHTGYPEATKATGNNLRGYKQWRHGNTYDKKTPNSSYFDIIWYAILLQST